MPSFDYWGIEDARRVQLLCYLSKFLVTLNSDKGLVIKVVSKKLLKAGVLSKVVSFSCFK